MGIGEDGMAGLTPAARSVVETAAVLVGGERHLALVDTTNKIAIPWQKPITATIDVIKQYVDQPVCILASGDPLWYGIGKLILNQGLKPLIMPAPSSFSLACARLGWCLEDIDTLSLCGRPVDLLRSYLAPQARLLVLSSNGDTPQAIASLLQQTGYGASKITVLSHLGGRQETIVTLPSPDPLPPLNLVAIECMPQGTPLLRSRIPGLPDSAYRHDGQLTKQAVRALTLSALSPAPGELLWDVGAGCGSIAIEWMRTDPRCQAIAIEPTRTEYISENAHALGVPQLQIIAGKAPEACQDLPPPHAVFIGGGITTPDLISTCLQSLLPGGRLVANAVTLESQALVYQWQQQLGGKLTRITIENTEPIGKFTIWKPSAPIVQWAVTI